jgi:predicted acyl esterase
MRLSALAVTLLALGLPAAARAASAPDAGTAFEPHPLSQPLYATKAPDADPDVQRHIVTAADGVALYVETWLPAAKDGKAPPARVPTILIATPYVSQGVERYPNRNLANVIAYFNARGYAVAQNHIRGTGESGGCLEQTSTHQIDDVARVIQYLGRDAPWSSGAVGMYGHSYDAETQTSTAGLGDPRLVYPWLKAIVPSASVAGQYEYSFFDGVPYTGQAIGSNGSYLATTSLAPGATSTPQQFGEKLTCQPEMMAGSIDQSGDMTPFWQVREYRQGAKNIRAATLWAHGLDDFNVKPLALAGFFDQLPATTPKAGVFGQWEHNYPDKHAGVEPAWARRDWLPTVLAWYDRYLKRLNTGVGKWPVVQVQDSTGQWRAEPDFPRTRGPRGALALGPGGTLGAVQPTGSTSYVEGPDEEDTIPGTRAVFETPAVAAPLHLTGQPVLDAWLTTDQPDGHVAAKIEVLDAGGNIAAHAGDSAQALTDFGYRSLRHLDPIADDHFVQTHGTAPPTGVPLHVPVRFYPTDLVVPAGGKLRLTVAGSVDGSEPSGVVPPPAIALLHDCAHTSALRFLMPRARPSYLNVRETDEPETGPLPDNPSPPAGLQDGAGLATKAPC